MSHSLSKLWKRLEPIITVVLLIYTMEPNVKTSLGAPSVVALLDRVLVALYYLFVIFVGVRDWKKLLYFLTSNKVLLLLLILPFFSVVWSITPEVSLSRFYRVVLRSTVFGLYLASRYSPRELMRLVGYALGFSVLISLVVALGMPSYGTSRGEAGAWRGIFAHKNHLGRVMIFASIYFAIVSTYIRKHRRLALLGFFCAFTMVLLSEAKSSLSICVGGLFLLPLYLSFRQAYRSKIFLQTVALLAVIVVTGWVANNIEYIITELLGKSLTLNGRAQLWTYLLGQIAKRPLLGYGYEAFWNNPEQVFLGNTSVGWFPSHAHSGFIDLTLQLGVIGFLLFLLCSLITLIRIIILLNLAQNVEYFWMMMLLIVMIASQYSIGNTILKDHLFWILYISTSTSACIELRRFYRTQRTEKIHILVPNQQN